MSAAGNWIFNLALAFFVPPAFTNIRECSRTPIQDSIAQSSKITATSHDFGSSCQLLTHSRMENVYDLWNFLRRHDSPRVLLLP